MPQESKAIKYIKRGNHLIKNGQVANGLLAIKNAWQIAPDNENILLASAGSLVDFGYHQEAIELIQSSLQHQANKPTLYEIAGNLANRMELYEIAEKFYQMALQKAPNLETAYIGLVTVLLHLGKQEQAIELLQSILPQFPKNAELWNLLGTVVRLHKRDFYSSEQFYLEAYRQDPKNIRVLLNLTNLYDGSEKAQRYFNEALKLDKKKSIGAF